MVFSFHCSITAFLSQVNHISKKKFDEIYNNLQFNFRAYLDDQIRKKAHFFNRKLSSILITRKYAAPSREREINALLKCFSVWFPIGVFSRIDDNDTLYSYET